MARPSAAIIHLDNVEHNFRLAQSLTPSGDCIAVVKANAYGHGALEVAQYLSPIAKAFAVCSCEEAAQLRLGGIEQPILLLEGPFAEDDVVFAAQQHCWLTIADEAQLNYLTALTQEESPRVFLKVDTGMHRMGVSPARVEHVLGVLDGYLDANTTSILMTHFACADEPSHPSLLAQSKVFDSLQEKVGLAVSTANSAAILTGRARGDAWSRPGIMLYGSDPLLESNEHSKKLKPTMSLVSQVIGLRDISAGESVGYGATWTATKPSRIATVAIGYADGYPRSLPSGTPVCVAGHICPLAGRVSMDMICVDVTDVPNVNVGSDVELWGENIPVDTIASFANTIAYELLARMPMRTPRLYRCANDVSLP